MAIYGYDASGADTRDADTVQPIRLSEVTFQFSAEDLRRIASFLLARADEIDADLFVEGGRHLQFLDPHWKADHPESDVIVVPIEPDIPKAQ